MKKLLLILVPSLVFSSAVFAKKAVDTSSNYEETILVVHQQNRVIIPAGVLLDFENCGWSVDLGLNPPWFGAKSELYSVQSKKTTGELLNDDIKKVGTLLGCTDGGDTTFERPANPENPEEGYETYDFGQTWALTLGSDRYIVTGMSRMRTDPTMGYLFDLPGTFLGVSTGTIFTQESIVAYVYYDGPVPVPVGSFSSNYIASLNPFSAIEHEGIITLRLYSFAAN